MADEFDSMIAANTSLPEDQDKYAHAYWHDPNMGKDLCYVSLEELAKENDVVRDLAALTFFFHRRALLAQAGANFSYTPEALINYVNHQGRYNSGALRQQIFPLPAVVVPAPYFVRST